MALFAFKTQAQNPNRLENTPLEWPWLKQQIGDHERAVYEQDNWIVTDTSDFFEYLKNKNRASDLRVMKYVEEEFSSLPPARIDFRKHLKVYLQKTVEMLPNGRPLRACYSYEGEDICQILFVFQTNEMNFVTRRTEVLFYYKTDGSVAEGSILRDDVYDLSNTYDLKESMSERSNARAIIIEEIKAVLNVFLASIYLPQGKTYPEILEIAGSFWEVYSPLIDSWINVGAPQFKTKLQAESAFEFLDAEIEPDVTARNYVLSKINY